MQHEFCCVNPIDRSWRTKPIKFFLKKQKKQKKKPNNTIALLSDVAYQRDARISVWIWVSLHNFSNIRLSYVVFWGPTKRELSRMLVYIWRLGRRLVFKWFVGGSNLGNRWGTWGSKCGVLLSHAACHMGGFPFTHSSNDSLSRGAVSMVADRLKGTLQYGLLQC